VRIAFDARAWEKPTHSFTRVLQLLFDAVVEIGWEVELWVSRSLRPEFARYERYARSVDEASRKTDARVLWSPQIDAYHAGVPVVSTVHDVNPLLPDGRPALARWQRARRFRSRVEQAFDESWRVVTDSEYSRRRISSEFPGHAGRVSVVPLYADRRLKRIDRAELGELVSRMGVSPGYILFVGSLRRHKNWEGLMRAYSRLPGTVRNEHNLVLAGPTRRNAERAERLAATLGIERQTVIPGVVPEEHMSALYSGADVFVFPSFLEGFGLPPLEAMACGVPVVATNRTSVPEVLGDAPLYIDPQDHKAMSEAIQTVLEDSSLKSRLIESGLRKCAEFSPARTASAMEKVLRELGDVDRTRNTL
jgi:glycosyltransferase involved in cell wall biosynthesis